MQIAAGSYHYLTRTNSGRVTYTGQNLYHEGDVEGWTDAVDISAGNKMSACVTSRGRVLLAGSLADQISPPNLNQDVGLDISGWRNIVQVAAGTYEVYGLKADGTVHMATLGDKDRTLDVSGLKDVTKLQASGIYAYGLQRDGTVLMCSNRDPVQLWTDIIDIEQQGNVILGLKADGTVVYRDWLAEQSMVKDVFAGLQSWTDIVALAADSGIIAGLRSDGTVVLKMAPEDVRSEVAFWTDVVAISAGEDYLIGLTSDGTVLSTAPFEGITP